MNLKCLIFILLLNFRASYGQILNCTFVETSSTVYTCNLAINNPNGFNNFTSIVGTHVAGKTDNDVTTITRSSGTTTNVPSIICDTFQNAVTFSFSGVQTVDDKAFRNCKQLRSLSLTSSRLSQIDENAFVENTELTFITFNGNQLTQVPENLFRNQRKLNDLRICFGPLTDLPKNIFNSLQNLTILHLESNQLKNLRAEWFLPLIRLQRLLLESNLIEELPRNLFISSMNLNHLTINGNKIKLIHSNSFRGTSNLRTIDFQGNQIEAIDEKFIDITGIQTINMNSNICANQSITDTNALRQNMRIALQKCFDNFDDSLLARVQRLEEAESDFNYKILEVKEENQQLTLTVNELNMSVNNTTAEVDKINSELQNINEEMESMRKNLENKIDDLAKENKHQNLLINELIWTNRPCSCPCEGRRSFK